MKFICTTVATLALLAGSATGATTFERSGGTIGAAEAGRDMIRLASGDYAMVGSSFPDAPPYYNMALGQLWDSSGSLLAQIFIDSPINDEAFGVTEFFDGLSDDLVWAIHTTDFTQGSHELAMVRLDNTTGFVWAKRFAGLAYGYAGDGGAIRNVGDSGFVVAGNAALPLSELVPAGNLLRVDTDGDVVFQLAYTLDAQNLFAVDFADVMYDALADNFVVVGTVSQVDGDPIVASDILVARISTSGAVIWAKTFDIASPDWTNGEQSYDRGAGLTIRSDGNIVVAALGDFGNTGYGSTSLLLLSSTGSLLGSTAVQQFQAANAAVRYTWFDNDVVVGGSYGFGGGGSQASMLLVDQFLNLKWRQTYADTSRGQAVLFLDDDVNPGFLLGGGTTNYTNGFEGEGYLVRTGYDGKTGCESPWNDVIPIIVNSTDVTLATHALPAPIAWQPTLTAVTPLSASVCTPVNPCPADFNGDGFLDFTDFDDFVSAFENGLTSADFNGDGFLDFTDFDDFVSAFENGC
jgi:hypothetical protein